MVPEDFEANFDFLVGCVLRVCERVGGGGDGTEDTHPRMLNEIWQNEQCLE